MPGESVGGLRLGMRLEEAEWLAGKKEEVGPKNGRHWKLGDFEVRLGEQGTIEHITYTTASFCLAGSSPRTQSLESVSVNGGENILPGCTFELQEGATVVICREQGLSFSQGKSRMNFPGDVRVFPRSGREGWRRLPGGRPSTSRRPSAVAVELWMEPGTGPAVHRSP